MNCWKPKVMQTMVISSQANEAAQARALEGSETSSRAKAVMLPRVPCTPSVGEDIVRYSVETRRAGLNSQHNTCYGVPVLYTPGKNVLFINVGRQTDFVGAP